MPGGVMQLVLGFPILGVCVFVLVKSRRSKESWSGMIRFGTTVGMVCAVLVIVWGLTRSLSLVRYLSKTVGEICCAESADVKAVEILPTSGSEAYPDLVNSAIRLKDRTKVREIVNLLKSAKPWDGSHPIIEWSCLLALDFGPRRAYCFITSTGNNGTLIMIFSDKDQGWLLGEYREDRLGDLLDGLSKEVSS